LRSGTQVKATQKFLPPPMILIHFVADRGMKKDRGRGRPRREAALGTLQAAVPVAAAQSREPAPGVFVPRGIALVIVVLAVLASYGGTLANGFVHDDTTEIVKNRFVHDLAHVRSIVTTPSWGFERQAGERPGVEGYHAESNYYRPVQYLSYALLYSAFGPAPTPYHAYKLILHLLACVLVYFILVRLEQEPLALPCVLLFAVHPALSEAVAWISAVTDVGCAVCFLLAFWAYLCWRSDPKLVRLLPLYLAFLVGMFSKETTIVFVPVLLAWQRFGEGAWPRPADWRRLHAPLVAIALFYLAVRVSVLGSFVVSGRERFSSLGFTQCILNQIVLLGEYLLRFLRPEPLNAFHVFEPVLSAWDPRFVTALVGLAAVAAAAYGLSRRLPATDRRLLLLGIVWTIFGLAPPLVFFRRVGENVFAERYLYLPFAGLCLSAAVALAPLLRRWPRPTFACLLLLSCFAAWRVRERTRVWHDPVVFYEDVMRGSPKAPLRQSLADAYADAGRLEDAVTTYHALLVTRTRSFRAYSNLGNVLCRLGRLEEAVGAYRASVAIEPNEMAFSNLGIALHQLGRYDEAIRAYSEAVALRPTSRAYHNLGTTYYLGQHQLSAAALAYEAALRLEPENEESRRALERVREELRRAPQR
jgi:tetratricopeptide (TPR) repeat protein